MEEEGWYSRRTEESAVQLDERVTEGGRASARDEPRERGGKRWSKYECVDLKEKKIKKLYAGKMQIFS